MTKTLVTPDNLNNAVTGAYRISGKGNVSHIIKIQEGPVNKIIWWVGQCFTPQTYVDINVLGNMGKYDEGNWYMELIEKLDN